MPRLRRNKPSRYRKGFTLPGYNYLGPFNGRDNGSPTNPTDSAAQLHDDDYEILQQSFNPYTTWNDADETFLHRIKSETDYGAYIARAAFRSKRTAADFGVLSSRATKRLRSSFANPTEETQVTMADGVGSGKDGGLEETPVDKIWSPSVHTGPEDYTWAKLPYMKEETVISSNNWMDTRTFRMTSPYDTFVSSTLTDMNAGAGTANTILPTTDGVDGVSTVDQARWFQFYAGMYKYYHVVEARWHITFENLTNELVWLHKMYCNEVDPPPAATNQDIRCWRNVESHLVGSHGVSLTSQGYYEANEGVGDNFEGGTIPTAANFESSNNIARRGISPIIELSGSYKPGDYKQEIHLDSEVENWSLVTTNPALTERLHFRVRPYNDTISANNASSYNRPVSFRYMLKIEYLVEFKELNTNLRWPVQRQPLTVNIQGQIDSNN